VAAAAAIELVHCASLVHDDLPCFDDAALRRNRPTVHVVFGEAIGVLVGDALLCMAFEVLARAGATGEAVLLASAVGPGRGIIAGQAWESEPSVDLSRYHRAKTAALFEAAAGAGAMAAGAETAPWRAFGEIVGRAYQAADDIADATTSSATLGKTSGRDAVLGRPSAVDTHGVSDARSRLGELLHLARASVPRARAAHHVHAWLDAVEGRLQAL
jgi:geranylgeranyl diphosphate synthase type II